MRQNRGVSIEFATSAMGLEPSFWLSAGYFRSTSMSGHSLCPMACLEQAWSRLIRIEPSFEPTVGLK